MVRTAATSIKVGAKASKGGGGSSRASNVRASSSSGGGSRRTIGGNKLIARPTPAWQKPITKFFIGGDKISTPKKLEYVEQVCEEEVVTLEPPHWQTSVSNFLVKQSDISKENSNSLLVNSDEGQVDTPVVPVTASVEETVEKVDSFSVKPSSEDMLNQKLLKLKNEKLSKKQQVHAGPSQSSNAYPQFVVDNNNFLQNQNNPYPTECNRPKLVERNQTNSIPKQFEMNNMKIQNDPHSDQILKCEGNANAENIRPNAQAGMYENNRNVQDYVNESDYLNPPKRRKFEGYKYLESYECPNQK